MTEHVRLHDFMSAHREQILHACEAELLASKVDSPITDVATFFDEIVQSLRRDAGHVDSQSPLPGTSTSALNISKERHGAGVAVTQLPPIFGAISQAIGKVGERYELTIMAEDYQRLNLCLDCGVATAIEDYWNRHLEREGLLITERFGFFAHELRNALGNASVAFRLLRDGKLGIGGHTGDVLSRSLTRMEALVAQFLASVQLEVGVPPDLHALSVNQLLRDLEASILPERGASIQLRIEAREELFALANSVLLTSALSNLVQNGLKFSPPAATISLRLRRSGEFAIIDVEDECGGLGAIDPKRLFEPYVKRAHDNPHGVGLGLSIAKRAVEAMHGTLAVVDLPGQGCVFSVCFPTVVAQRTSS